MNGDTQLVNFFIFSFFDRTNKYLKKLLMKSIRPRGNFYRPTVLFMHPVIDSLYLLVGRLIWPVGRNRIRLSGEKAIFDYE